MKLYTKTISEALAGLQKGEFQSQDLVASCLQRITETDHELNSFISVNEGYALERARQEDEKRLKGKAGRLSGVPFSIKDLLCTKEFRTTCGSRMLENFTPPYDATVVEKLEKDGAVIIGKTSMDEFAMGSTSENCVFGVPQNPWKKDMSQEVRPVVQPLLWPLDSVWPLLGLTQEDPSGSRHHFVVWLV